MIERPNVDALMAGELGRFLQGQVQVREAAKAKTNKRYFVSALVLLPLLSFLWFTPLGDFRLFLTVAAGMGALWWSRIPAMRAKKETKSGINAAIAEALGLEYAHDCDGSHGFERAKSHKMFPNHQRSNFEDLWSGEITGLPFTLHEAHLQERRGSGKNRRWVTVFRGPVITIGFKRTFHATTLLERSGRHRKFLFFGEADQITLDGVVLDKADMVHPDFEDTFTVFTSDQTEARYLVHPVYIERLIALEQAFQGQGIKTLFKDRELTIVLTTENMFESGSLNHQRDREMVEMSVAQFMAMAELCAALNEPER
ncbi:DUF3137 domain-containing protein [Aurantiacibacter sp. MUD11]|uniref:DUF3137 domain-containing protein n=1 Tax=Aurantiacibacter sp. MUD11 TaxID=3003265 RepID=UPI0022AA6553|nr:DUF3137 domain-containing protein [Aurantiacibacter sp. MUD11]WAT18594.1 DUF3137 domain-containing protein [Aurantiacibacter sp. MUD11]